MVIAHLNSFTATDLPSGWMFVLLLVLYGLEILLIFGVLLSNSDTQEQSFGCLLVLGLIAIAILTPVTITTLGAEEDLAKAENYQIESRRITDWEDTIYVIESPNYYFYADDLEKLIRQLDDRGYVLLNEEKREHRSRYSSRWITSRYIFKKAEEHE